MKNRKFAKIVLLTLLAALVLGTVFAVATSADDTETKPQIISQNIRYSKDFRLMYAVDAASVSGPVELRVYASAPTEETEDAYIKKYTVEEVTPAAETGNLGRDAYIITTDGISYADMADLYYVQAIDTATGAKSEVKRYSVAEYFYEKLADPDVTEVQKDLYKSAIQFGTNVQKALGNVTDEAKLISNLRYVVVDGGTLDGYKAGLYAVGETIAPLAVGVSNWNVVLEGEGGKELTTVQNGTSVKIPESKSLVKMTFTAADKFSYPENYDDLESYTDLAEVGSALIASTTNSPVLELMQDDTRGNVLKYTLTKDRIVGFGAFDSSASAEDATAFVASFDMKVDISNREESAARGIIEFGIRVPNGTSLSKYMRLQLQVIADGTTAKFGVGTEGNFASSLCDLNTDEWFNLKIVQYKGDSTKFHVYINGIKSFVLNNNATNRKNAVDNYSDEIYATISTEGTGKNVTNVDCYLDNLFVGYTTETASTAEATPPTTVTPTIVEDTTDDGTTEGGGTTPTYNFTPDDLESYNSWTEVESALVNKAETSYKSNNVTFGTGDAEQGNYFVFNSKQNSILALNQFDTGVTESDATAFVVSFKAKLDVTGATFEASHRGAIELKLLSSDGAVWMRLSIWMYNNSAAASIGINHEGNPQSTLHSVATDDWFDIKLVQYAGDSTKVKMYINGELAQSIGANTANSNRKNVVDNYDEGLFAEIWTSATLYNADFYFDDIFVGYTTDTIPE